MQRMVLGAVIALMLAGLGLFWWQGRAQVEQGAPPPFVAPPSPDAATLPITDPGQAIGPAPPEATELTREQQRFFRYDRNRDWRITRAEMLSTRSDGFRKLDRDGNNLLTFEEWAVTTVDKFEGADKDHNRELSPAEFAATAPTPAPTRSCRC